MKRIAFSAIVGMSLLAACVSAPVASADTLAAHVKTMRDYDLSDVDGSAPARPVRFYIGDNSAFAACGKCLCATGIMTGRYPNLGIRPTSASPTFACAQGSAEFEMDASLLSQFLDMKTARSEGDVVLFENAWPLGGGQPR